MSYYYIISSLPGISLEAKPALSLDDFRALCSAQLSNADAAAVECLLDIEREPANHSFVAEWRARETQLRNASARLRAAGQSRDAADFIRSHTGFDVSIEDRVEEAFNRSNPLERERELDRIRWTMLNELAGTDPFSANALFAYAVKLSLAERWAAMDKEAGQNKIEKAIAEVKKNQTDNIDK
jgi:hypothetical protein